MKTFNLKWIVVSILILSLGFWVGCGLVTVSEQGTQELAYTLINGGTEYSVSHGSVTSGDVIIPATWKGKPVTVIGDGAFGYCWGLTSVTIPSSVTSISVMMRSMTVAGLTSVTIGGSVTSIGDSAFAGCSGLTSVTIPSSVNEYWI